MGQDQVSGGVSVLCWLAAPVASMDPPEARSEPYTVLVVLWIIVSRWTVEVPETSAEIVIIHSEQSTKVPVYIYVELTTVRFIRGAFGK